MISEKNMAVMGENRNTCTYTVLVEKHEGTSAF